MAIEKFDGLDYVDGVESETRKELTDLAAEIPANTSTSNIAELPEVNENDFSNTDSLNA